MFTEARPVDANLKRGCIHRPVTQGGGLSWVTAMLSCSQLQRGKPLQTSDLELSPISNPSWKSLDFALQDSFSVKYLYHCHISSWVVFIRRIVTYLKTILQVSFRYFTRLLFWEENWLWNLGSSNCFTELAKAILQRPALVKTVLCRETSRLSRESSAALSCSSEVQTFILQMHGRASVCAMESLVVEVHGSTSAGEEPAPRMLEGEDCTPSYFFCALVFVPFAPLLDFLGKRSVRSRLCCLVCFSANLPCLTAACQGPNLMVSVLI